MLEAASAALADPALVFPVTLTLKIAVLTLIIEFFLGLAIGWALAVPRWPGRTLLDALITLPLVFPPIAMGFVLLVMLGRQSPIGSFFESDLGLTFVFSTTGVLVASVVAGLPLVVKPIEAAIASVSRGLGEASRTLGRSELETFFFVVLPNIRNAVAAGLVLGTARSVGEVGITLMLGGNIVGRTNTMSLEIYNAVMYADYQRASVLSLLLGLASLAVLVVLRRVGRGSLG